MTGRLLWLLGNFGYAQGCVVAPRAWRGARPSPGLLSSTDADSNERHCWLTAVSSASLRASLEWKYGPKRTRYASAGQVSGCQSWLRK